MDGREINMNGNPRPQTPNATSTLDHIQAQSQQLPSRTATTPLSQGLHLANHKNHSARAGVSINTNPQNISQNAEYVVIVNGLGSLNISGYTPTSQAAYPNTSTGSLGSIWLPDVYMQDPGDFDMNSFQPASPSLQNHQWGDQYPAPTYR